MKLFWYKSKQCPNKQRWKRQNSHLIYVINCLPSKVIKIFVQVNKQCRRENCKILKWKKSVIPKIQVQWLVYWKILVKIWKYRKFENKILNLQQMKYTCDENKKMVLWVLLRFLDLYFSNVKSTDTFSNHSLRLKFL